MKMPALTVLPLVLTLALLGGCWGGDDKKADKVASQDEEAAERMRKYAKCMRDNGIDMPDPDVNGAAVGGAGDGADPEAIKAALAKCRQYQPGGDQRTKLDPATLAKIRAFAMCMRENGIDMPDPDENGQMTSGRKDSADERAISPDDPRFKAADEKCRHHLPSAKDAGR